MTEVVFSAKKKGESRYEETISDRPATSGARVSTTGPRRKPQPAVDLSDDRGRRTAARRGRPSHARSRVGIDEPGEEEEVRHLAGERHEQHPARRAHRWGK